MLKQIFKKLFLYKWYRNRKNERYQLRTKIVSDAFKKEAVDVLRLFSSALIRNNVSFWLCSGTLLGYYREHDFIKHDFDLDTGAWYKDRDRVRAALEENGFERVRYYYILNKDGLEECYKHKDYATTIDVFYFIEDGDYSFCYSFNPMVSMTKKRHLNKVQKSKAIKWTWDAFSIMQVDFKGVTVNVPQDTAHFLETLYGKTFMTPIPNYPIKGRPNMTEYTYEEMPACAFLKIGYI